MAAVGPNNINIFAVDLAAQNMVTLSLIDDFYGKNFHFGQSDIDLFLFGNLCGTGEKRHDHLPSLHFCRQKGKTDRRFVNYTGH